MLLLAIYVLYAAVLGRAVGEVRRIPQTPLVFGEPSGLGGMPGGSMVTLCPESRGSDVLVIERIINRPQEPILYVLPRI